VPYVGGALKQAGFDDVRFIDAMTNYIEDEALAVLIEQHQPDVVMGTVLLKSEGQCLFMSIVGLTRLAYIPLDGYRRRTGGQDATDCLVYQLDAAGSASRIRANSSGCSSH
jgi:hypothetical protein